MKNYKVIYLLTLLVLFFHHTGVSQNQASKWCFGNQAGLDFMTNPPTVFSHTMSTTAGCASIADAAGNLLFYTNGYTVWNSQNQTMAGGPLQNNNVGIAQTSIIVKQPGNTNIYYIFTPAWNGNNAGFSYSTVDMNLAAGLGSITVANATLLTNNINNNNNYYFTDKVSATKHCNGTDIWVVTEQGNYNYNNNNNQSNNFYAFLVTAAGVSTTPVMSAATTWTNNYGWNTGCMKFSPNGTKLGLSSSDNWNNNNNNGNNDDFQIWDFNAGTGVMTNSVALDMNNNNINGWSWGYGCEFSPDGTKFYGSSPYWYNNGTDVGIGQWDLCAGSPTAIAASLYTVAVQNNNNNNNNWYYSMQVAPNGKIYVARYLQTSLDVIANPNAAGLACGYTALAQSTGTKMCYQGLPNFMTSYFSQQAPPPPFTYTINNTTSCLTTSFTAPTSPTFACSAMGFAPIGVSWNFGDPNSGPVANTSTLYTPVHTYPVPGTYTAVLNYITACGSNSVALPVVINGASLTITTASITCASLGSATVTAAGGTGPFSYTWMPTAQTNSVANGLQPGNYSITVVDNGGNCAYTSTVNFASLVPFTGQVDNSLSNPCNGVGTGTAAIITAGGSGNNNYFWTNGVTTLTTATVNNLAAGFHTITVIDALTSCSVTQNFFINQPPAMALNVAANTPTACASASITFMANNSGGTPGPLAPGYTYTWTGGPTTNTYTVSQAAAGTYSYYVNSRDGNNCLISNSIVVSFVANPTISISNVSICPLQVGTLTPSGATSYTWLPSGLSGPTFTDNPLITTNYTINGSALGCTATPKTASIVLKPVPSPTISSNSPVCNGQSLNMSSNSGSAYLWNGPLSFTSALQNPSVNPASPNNSGVYSLTLTGVNSCTASTTATLTVHPTPTVSTAANTVCVTQTVNLTANSFPGATYNWAGPSSFTSALQNPSITPATTLMTGAYNLTVTSIQGCTNTSIANASVVAMPVPVITVNSPSLCLGANLTLNGSGGVSYSWSGPNGFASPLQATGITNIALAANGVYSLVVTTGPCVISTTQSITVFPLPSPSAMSYSTCDGKDLVFSAVAGGGITYSWTGPLAFSSSLLNPTITAASPLNSGLYSLLVTDVNGCQAGTSTQVNILLNPVVQTTGITVCIGNPAVLTASGAVSYAWSGPGNYSSNFSSANIAAATYSNPQVYTVMGTAANSCTSIATAVLATIPLPKPSLLVTPRACVNSTISLQGFGGDFYQWEGPYNLFAKTQNVNFTAVNVAYGGTYTLTAFSNAGCSAKTTTVVQIDPAPDGDLINTSGNSCVPFCSDFSLVNKSGSPVVNTSWQINGSQFDTPVFKYCFAQAGSYVVTGSFTNAVGCMNSSTFQVHGYPLPSAGFEFFPEHPQESFDAVTFNQTSSGEQLKSWDWFFIDNAGYKTSGPNVNYTFEKNGTYPIAMVVKNVWGCADTLVKAITVEPGFEVYVPNAFTPNADDLNDVFAPKGTGVVKYNLVVYDRWGGKLFQSSDFTKGWDGTFKGQECKSDVYVWKISATDHNGKEKSLNGFVTLYR